MENSITKEICSITNCTNNELDLNGCEVAVANKMNGDYLIEK